MDTKSNDRIELGIIKRYAEIFGGKFETILKDYTNKSDQFKISVSHELSSVVYQLDTYKRIIDKDLIEYLGSLTISKNCDFSFNMLNDACVLNQERLIEWLLANSLDLTNDVRRLISILCINNRHELIDKYNIKHEKIPDNYKKKIMMVVSGRGHVDTFYWLLSSLKKHPRDIKMNVMEYLIEIDHDNVKNIKLFYDKFRHGADDFEDEFLCFMSSNKSFVPSSKLFVEWILYDLNYDISEYHYDFVVGVCSLIFEHDDVKLFDHMVKNSERKDKIKNLILNKLSDTIAIIINGNNINMFRYLIDELKICSNSVFNHISYFPYKNIKKDDPNYKNVVDFVNFIFIKYPKYNDIYALHIIDSFKPFYKVSSEFPFIRTHLLSELKKNFDDEEDKDWSMGLLVDKIISYGDLDLINKMSENKSMGLISPEEISTRYYRVFTSQSIDIIGWYFGVIGVEDIHKEMYICDQTVEKILSELLSCDPVDYGILDLFIIKFLVGNKKYNTFHISMFRSALDDAKSKHSIEYLLEKIPNLCIRSITDIDFIKEFRYGKNKDEVIEWLSSTYPEYTTEFVNKF